MEPLVEVRALAVPTDEPMDGEGVTQVVEARLVARVGFPVDVGAGARPPEGAFRGLPGNRPSPSGDEENVHG